MRVCVLAVGSRGDVAPYVALGAGLARTGHRVTIAAAKPFRDLVEEHGLAFAALSANPRDIIETEEGQAWLASARNPVTFFAGLRRLALRYGTRLADDIADACAGTEAVVASSLALAGYHVAEALGVPYLGALLQPTHATAAHPTMVTPVRSLGAIGNRWSGCAANLMLDVPFRGLVNGWRRDRLGLPPMPLRGLVARIARQHPTLYGYSALVAPKPRDWGPRLHVTGYWALPGSSSLPLDLADFLDAGPPPVFVGFGSMRPRHPAAVSAVVVKALRLAGVRGVLGAGWAGLAAQGSDQVAVVGEAPHDHLFPRMAAVVHHGGAGTTGTALRAGVPSLAVPFFADQYFWGHRLAALGVGPAPLPVNRLTSAALAGAVRRLVDQEGLRHRAAALGARLAEEDGVAAAVAAYERLGGGVVPGR